jgi:glutamate synthase domain-containing protein 2
MTFHRLLPARYYPWAGCLIAAVASLFFVQRYPAVWAVTAVTGFLGFIGTLDFFQARQAIRRNYPIMAHIRFFLEFIRPEIRQYFLETDTERIPFSRAQRSLAYQRAKNVIDKRPYGTLLDVHEQGYDGSTIR